MRGKVRGRQYATWQELVRDFELIVSNAFKFNPKRSRVHKAVRALLYLRCASNGSVAPCAGACVHRPAMLHCVVVQQATCAPPAAGQQEMLASCLSFARLLLVAHLSHLPRLLPLRRRWCCSAAAARSWQRRSRMGAAGWQRLQPP